MNKLIIALLIFCFYSCKEGQEKKQNLKNKETLIKNTDSRKDTLVWFTELCEMTSSFDGSKYSKKQLKDTYKLWFDSNIYLDFKGYPSFELTEKIDSIDILENKYKDIKNNIEKLEIVKLPFWENLKKTKLLQLKIYYDFEKTAYNAYRDLNILKQTKFDPKAKIYVEALTSSNQVKILNAWKVLIETQKSDNSTPEYLEEKFQLRLKSSQSLEYAKMDLFTFGWANHVYKSCEECKLLERQDLMLQEFQKLLIATKEECDEP
ncbi:MAG: hypothetical protein ACOVQ2_00980 [Flavobacterium sp.]